MKKRVVLYLILFLVISVPAMVQAENLIERAAAALEEFNGHQGELAWGNRVGSLQSTPAFGSPVYCEIQLDNNVLKIVQIPQRDSGSSDMTGVKKDIYIFPLAAIATEDKDGSFTTAPGPEKNNFSVCIGDTVTAQYSLKIDKKRKAISIIRWGTCKWRYQDNPTASFSECVECRRLIECRK